MKRALDLLAGRGDPAYGHGSVQPFRRKATEGVDERLGFASPQPKPKPKPKGGGWYTQTQAR